MEKKNNNPSEYLYGIQTYRDSENHGVNPQIVWKYWHFLCFAVPV